MIHLFPGVLVPQGARRCSERSVEPSHVSLPCVALFPFVAPSFLRRYLGGVSTCVVAHCSFLSLRRGEGEASHRTGPSFLSAQHVHP